MTGKRSQVSWLKPSEWVGGVFFKEIGWGRASADLAMGKCETEIMDSRDEGQPESPFAASEWGSGALCLALGDFLDS